MTPEIYSLRDQIEFYPDKTYEAAGLLLQEIMPDEFESYEQYLPIYMDKSIVAKRMTPDLRIFDIARLGKAIRPERDLLFDYPGLQTLYDRYLLRNDLAVVIEPPQCLWMRIAMALAINEDDKEARAIEFYEVMSLMLYSPATPTLFDAGTLKQQCASCFLTTVRDSLEEIFDAIKDNALLSKYAGGLGNDWTNIRSLGKVIEGTHGNSQGVIPFLKIVNDTAVAVNQGGKRQGAVCVYLENWHLDIEDFLDLCKNTGDERRRCPDLHTACWISDEFMRRVEADEDWTLFSPNDVPDLHDLYSSGFANRYKEYEAMADKGEIKLFKRVSAKALWRHHLGSVYETGHPWVTFKDTSNDRNPQLHCGTIHSSNLCTEIMLNTSKDEIAVCNLGSVNLSRHTVDGKLDADLLKSTVQIAVRMLDNVIDINYYPVPEAENANKKHRPIGLGIMGFQDMLYKMGLSYNSQEAIRVADESMELLSYCAIEASSDLAMERGSYSSIRGSDWYYGIMPIDTNIETVDQSKKLEWGKLSQKIYVQGMRNSNVTAIAPTATISIIAGCSQSIEPQYRNLYVKSNLSGDFTSVNRFLIADLKEIGLWDRSMLEKLKYYDGSVQHIPEIPVEIKDCYKTAFEIDPRILIECASRRQKWIDQGQSFNLYISEASGKKINDMYFLCWKKGLKTTYYLRAQAATQIEKSTVDINKFGIQPRWMESKSESANVCTSTVCEVCQ